MGRIRSYVRDHRCGRYRSRVRGRSGTCGTDSADSGPFGFLHARPPSTGVSDRSQDRKEGDGGHDEAADTEPDGRDQNQTGGKSDGVEEPERSGGSEHPERDAGPGDGRTDSPECPTVKGPRIPVDDQGSNQLPRRWHSKQTPHQRSIVPTGYRSTTDRPGLGLTNLTAADGRVSVGGIRPGAKFDLFFDAGGIVGGSTVQRVTPARSRAGEGKGLDPGRSPFRLADHPRSRSVTCRAFQSGMNHPMGRPDPPLETGSPDICLPLGHSRTC